MEFGLKGEKTCCTLLVQDYSLFQESCILNMASSSNIMSVLLNCPRSKAGLQWTLDKITLPWWVFQTGNYGSGSLNRKVP